MSKIYSLLALLLLAVARSSFAVNCEAYPLSPFHKDLLAVSTPQLFPTACVEYGMKATLKNLASIHYDFFSTCSNPSGMPRKSNTPMCVNEDYIHVTQKSIEVVGDCLNLPLKEILPKLKGESGFFHNALGRGFDAGIGQLTQSALVDARKEMKMIQKTVWQKAPQHPSCQFLQKHWDSLTHLHSTSARNRCELISWPLNPLKNFLWFGAYFLWLKKIIHLEYEGYRIPKKLPSLDHKALQGILTNVAYNAGPQQIVQLLSVYIDKKKRLGIPITNKDFNFKEDLSWINRVKPENWRKIPIKSLTFPGYVKIYLHIGHPGYLPDLMKQIYKYNNALGSHMCTPEYIEGYLAL